MAAAVVGVLGVVLAWAAARPSAIRDIDVSVPEPSELSSPSAAADRPPRCITGGLERDCVVWEFDAMISSAERHGELLVVTARDGMVAGIDLRSGEAVWEVRSSVRGAPYIWPIDTPGRVVVGGDGVSMLVDAATGTELARFDGFLHQVDAGRSGRALIVDEDFADGTTTVTAQLLDLVTGTEIAVWDLEPNSYTVALGPPMLVIEWDEQGSHLGARALTPDGELLWEWGTQSIPFAVGEHVYGITPYDNRNEGDPATLEARDPQTGELVWATDLGPTVGGGGVSLAPHVGLILTPTTDGIAGIDAASGEIRWVNPGLNQVSVYGAERFARPGEVVMSQWTAVGQNQLIGLDADTGEKRWESPTLGDRWFEPSMITDIGVLTASSDGFAITRYDGTQQTFDLDVRLLPAEARILTVDPLVVFTGYSVLGLDSDAALPEPTQPDGG